MRTWLVLVWIGYGLAAAAAPLHFFKGTWAQAQAEAKKSGKQLFVDAYADWCGPCKYMDKNVFVRDEIGDFFNTHFVNYKMDMDGAEGQVFGQTYDISSMPTYVFVTPTGQVSMRQSGAMEAADFLELGKNAHQLASLQAAYAAGDRSDALIRQLLLLQAGSDSKEGREMAKAFFAAKPVEYIQSREGFDLWCHYAEDDQSREFAYYFQHKDKFSREFGDQAVQPLIGVYEVQYRRAMESRDQAAIERLAKILGNAAPLVSEAVAKETESELYFNFYVQSEQWEKFFDYAPKYLDLYAKDKGDLRVSAAYQYVLHATKAQHLKYAEGLMRSHISDFGPNYYNGHVLASLLHRQGDTKSAVAVAKEAIQYAKLNAMDHALTDELLKEMGEK